MAKVTKAMKKKTAAEGSGKEVPSEVPRTQPAKIDTTAREAHHKAEIVAREAKIEKLKEENWDLLDKNKELEGKAKEIEGKAKELESKGKEMEKELEGLGNKK
ncbi:hypothetical protein JCGZ_01158 [Jatropha curcas]|uniref:Uncharacterized protein n=1 Tax=Jatropha curcas TaxID=180498 RepID=A0A067L3D5_JATCU|nr:hypothetical protein JCGZ_01158 [Jatropha curcas]